MNARRFPPAAPITKSQVLAPPEISEPINLQAIIVADPQKDPVHFSWKPVPTAKIYDFQASTTTMFNQHRRREENLLDER